MARTGAAIESVIFDLDGVLVDSFGVMRRAFASAYAECVGDGPAPFEEYCRHLGRYFTDILDIMSLPRAMEGPFVRESQRLVDEITTFDGVTALLAELARANVSLAVATGKAGARARSLLAHLDLLDCFEAVLGGDEVERAKPAPDIMIASLAALQADPARTIVVGDAVTDVLSGRSAGLPVIGASWGQDTPDELLGAGADAVVGSPLELLEYCRVRAFA